MLSPPTRINISTINGGHIDQGHQRPTKRHIEGDSIPGHGHPIATGHTEEDVLVQWSGVQ